MLLFRLEAKFEAWCYFLCLKTSLKPGATFYTWRKARSLMLFLYLKSSLKLDCTFYTWSKAWSLMLPFMLEQKLETWCYFLYLKRSVKLETMLEEKRWRLVNWRGWPTSRHQTKNRKYILTYSSPETKPNLLVHEMLILTTSLSNESIVESHSIRRLVFIYYWPICSLFGKGRSTLRICSY